MKLTTSVAVIQSVPPEQAGVASATLQTSFQIGSTVSIGIATALQQSVGGGIQDWESTRAGFYYLLAMGVLWLVGFLVFFKPPRALPVPPASPPPSMDAESVVMH